MLKSGLDGIDRKLDPGPSVNKNIFRMSQREKRRLRIDDLPADLNAALRALRKDAVVSSALSDHILNHFIEAKQAAWQEYIAVVHAWEVERYLTRY
jgi:glutamine synthetase